MLLIGVLLLSFAQVALAWSSSASRTEMRIRILSSAIESYRAHFGKLPSPEQFWIGVRPFDIGPTNDVAAPTDDWGRPLIYRMPGQHGDFDLYSLGADGIDQGGGRDDISNWAGVNDGYHWKATWPAGRIAIAAGAVLGIGTHLMRRWLPRRGVLPLAGSIACLGLGLGCWWLKHPGVVSSRNGPLTILSASAFCLSVALLAVFLFHVRNKSRPEPVSD
jgi:general secretion pathway protein G